MLCYVQLVVGRLVITVEHVQEKTTAAVPSVTREISANDVRPTAYVLLAIRVILQQWC